MWDINYVNIVGTVAKDFQLSSGGTSAVAFGTVLTVKKFKDKEFKTYHTIKAFGEAAKKCANCKEGTRVFITGENAVEKYNDQWQKYVKVNELCIDSPSKMFQSPSNNGYQQPTGQNPEDFDDDIPF